MKTIYFIINDISMPGGLSRVTLNIYEELSKYKNKYNIKIITATLQNKTFDLGNSIINLNLKPLHSLNKFQKLIWYIKFIFIINKFLKNQNVDIAVGIGTIMNLSLSLYIKKIYKLYVAEHTSYYNNNKIVIFLRKFLYRRVDRIISLTKEDEKKYRKINRNVITIPNFTNFYNIKNFSNLNSKTLLFIGRFTKIKGVDILIEIMKEFFKIHKEWKLIMYGEGPLKIQIRELIKEYKLINNIEINEPIKDIETAYLKSDILLMTSRNEGFPMVLLEAKAFGLPIIAFDCKTGPKEIIKDKEDGFIISYGKQKEFLDKLNLLVQDYNLRKQFGKKALEDIKNYYPDKIIKKWEMIFDE